MIRRWTRMLATSLAVATLMIGAGALTGCDDDDSITLTGCEAVTPLFRRAVIQDTLNPVTATTTETNRFLYTASVTGTVEISVRYEAMLNSGTTAGMLQVTAFDTCDDTTGTVVFSGELESDDSTPTQRGASFELEMRANDTIYLELSSTITEDGVAVPVMYILDSSIAPAATPTAVPTATP